MRLLRDLVGETLSDRYRILARIAGGGMGEVYRGHDLLLDRPVAVKVLQPSLASDADLVDRFKAEARAAARLNHPNVVAVHDWGSDDDRTYYMVMEYVSGSDLRDLLVGRGPFEPRNAVEVTISICDAIQAAHATGLVHRDVKPENVLITRDGIVKVADFGIAGVIDAERTMPGGSILGTLRYLAPEQASGGQATRSSDVWATGAVLFELLTGAPLQTGTGAELLRRRAEEPAVAPSTLEPAVPQVVDEIVLKACALDPSDRFASIAEMGAALRAAAAELPQTEKPVKELLVDLTEDVNIGGDAAPTDFLGRNEVASRKRRRIGKVAVIALLLVLGAFGIARAVPGLMGPAEVEVPQLVGLTQEQAGAAAQDLGLGIEVSARERHPTVPEGSVISQDPADGVLLEGENVAVVVSKGKPLVTVPNLVGDKRAKAEKRLADRHLVVGTVHKEFSIDQPKGHVIEVIADSKRMEWGSEVDLVVSKGPRRISVPSVAGLKFERAADILQTAGFTVVQVDVYSNDVKKGRVVSTSPPGGTEADEGSTIQVAVSIGAQYKKVEMPDVIGMHQKDARQILRDLELRVRIRKPGECEGRTTVLETDPSPGTTIRQNDVVTLFVC